MSEFTDENQKLAIYAQVNVDHQINKIISEFTFKTKIQKQELYVVGMVFDIHGVYGAKSANVYITNINGITDIAKLKKHEVASEISKNLSDLKFKRL
jgi:ribosome-binding factor A